MVRPTRLYVLVVAVWALTRAIAWAILPHIPHVLNDIDIYEGWLPTIRGGGFPVGDPTWQYPPGAGLLLALPDLAPGAFLPSFAIFLLIVDLGILAMLIVAHRRRRERSDLGLWLWATAGLTCGTLLLTRFDVLPTFFAVAAILAVASPVRSGALAGLGALVKGWPVLVLLALPRARTIRGAVAFLTTVVLTLAVTAVWFDDVLSFLANQASRGLQVESTGALGYWLAGLVSGPVDYGLDYGSMQIRTAHAGTVGTVLTVLGVAIVAVIAWWRLRGRLEAVAPADVVLVAVIASVATSRVYSPQFNVWLIGLAAVATISTRTRLRPVALILVGVSVCTQVVYPLFPSQLTDGVWWMIGIQAVRIGGLLVGLALGLRVLYRAGRSAHRATADAAATFSESTPPAIGTRTTTSDD